MQLELQQAFKARTAGFSLERQAASEKPTFPFCDKEKSRGQRIEDQIQMTENFEDESQPLIPQLELTEMLDENDQRLNLKSRYQRLPNGKDIDF